VTTGARWIPAPDERGTSVVSGPGFPDSAALCYHPPRPLPYHQRPAVQLLLAPFQSPLVFVIFALSVTMAAIIIIPALRSAMSAAGPKPAWVRAITGVNARYLFGALILIWALVFGITLQLVPHEGANSPYGALGLIALFSGFFVFMGFVWAVVRD
jgi:hypothetical protein